MIKGKISPELLQKIKSAINLVDIVGENVVLRKSGANYSGLCPFHSERTPSFSVSESKQLYHCYGCKKGGDLITFVMEVMGVSFPDAVEDLAERAKIPLPRDWSHSSDENPEEEKKRAAFREKQALAFKLNRFAAAFFHQNLKLYPQAHEYLRLRGAGENLIQSFYLGAATDSWDSLANHLTNKKAPLDLAVELGLIRPSVKAIKPGGSGNFDLFRNRVIFPILNLRGKVAGFGGRVLGDQSPKYLNSSDSFIFQKSKLAFGLYQAQKYIRERDEIILVEGYFDVLAMHAAGFKNVVATCGTSLTSEHLTLFQRFASRVTVLFDGDQAGISATDRAMELGLDHGQVLYGAQMPPDLDPDEMVMDLNTGTIRTEGKEQMSALLSAAKPLLDVKIDEAIRSAQQGPEDRTQALKKVGAWLSRFKDSVGREVRAQHVQKQLGISRQLILEVMGKLPGSSQPVGKGQGATPAPNKQPRKDLPLNRNEVKMSQVDRTLIAGLALGGEFSALFAEARDSLPPKKGLSDLFDYPAARAFMTSILSKPGYLEQLRMVPEKILGEDLDPQIRAILTEVLVSTEPSTSLEEFRGAISKSLARNWARFSQYIKTSLADAELKKDAELQAHLMKEYLDVQRKMKEFSSFYDEE